MDPDLSLRTPPDTLLAGGAALGLSGACPGQQEDAGLQEARELLAEVAYDDHSVSEVIRPAAILPQDAARRVLVELSLQDVASAGLWRAQPALWRRYDRVWQDPDTPGPAELLGSIQVAYGTPTRYEITIFRATVTQAGLRAGMSVSSLCDEALSYAGLSLASCPRASLAAPPQPFRLH